MRSSQTHIAVTPDTKNLLFILKKGRTFEELLNKMANYFIKSELDVFSLRPYAEETILKELQTIKKEQERTIKIIKAQEKDYKSLFATKNDLQTIQIGRVQSEIITVEDLQNNGMTQDELLSLIDAANENNRVISRQEKRIEELEMKVSQGIQKKNTSPVQTFSTAIASEADLVQMNFREVLNEFLKLELDREKFIQYRKTDELVQLISTLVIVVAHEPEDIKQGYQDFFDILEDNMTLKSYITDDLTTGKYRKLKSHLISLL